MKTGRPMIIELQPANTYLNIGQLKGTFFNAKLINGEFPGKSPFGDYRFVISANKLYLNHFSLYFSDFYCNQTSSDAHYVTLVLARNQSAADQYCQLHLFHLDPSDNHFFRKVNVEGKNIFLVNKKFKFWVEIFCTEDVSLREGKISRVKFPTFRSSNPSGIPNNPVCQICN